MLRRTVTALLVSGTVLAAPAVALAAVSGPDVSHYQHPGGVGIGWTAVKASGQTFVFHKATEGLTYTDPTFARDRRDARSVGLIVGAYHFARPAGGPANATAQARRFVATLGTTRHLGELPPVLDLETTGGLTPPQLIAWTRVFLTTVRSLSGRTPIVYSYPSFWKTAMAGTKAFSSYPLWGACYCAGPTNLGGAWTHWTLWQYSSHSHVRGIAGRSDMNRFNGSLAQLRALTNQPPARRPAPVVKVGTVLTAGAPEAVPSGQAFAISGTLMTKGGRPVAKREVLVSGRAAGTARWWDATTVTTSSSGTWTAQLRAPFDVELIARFLGDAGALPSTSTTLRLAVTPAAR
ncbi:MAG: glycoside hydrolase family 25 protein [Mycobacteriales bacterium]